MKLLLHYLIGDVHQFEYRATWRGVEKRDLISWHAHTEAEPQMTLTVSTVRSYKLLCSFQQFFLWDLVAKERKEHQNLHYR